MTIREHELQVPRTARYYTLGDVGPAVRDCWMVCHGYGQLAQRFIQLFEPIASPERVIVAPEGLSRFYTDVHQREKVGASWMTREHREAEIKDYVAYLDAVRDQVKGGRLTAFGFSQGASTASRWTAFGKHKVDRLILWGGELPPDLDLGPVAEKFAGVEVVVVRGKHDDYITPKIVAGILSRLKDHDIDHRFMEFDGEHQLNTPVLTALASQDPSRL